MTKKQYTGLLALTFFAGLIGGAAANWFLIGPPAFAQKSPPPASPASIIEAKSFHLVDKNGVLRGGLTILDDGTAGLVLANASAKSVIKLAVSPNGKSGITLYDNNEHVRALLVVQPDGTPSLSLKGVSKSSAAITFNPDGNPSLDFWDKDGKQHAIPGNVDSNGARTNPD